LEQHTKTGEKTFQITKLIPKGREIYQVAVNK
jgi:hypothetical protein